MKIKIMDSKQICSNEKIKNGIRYTISCPWSSILKKNQRKFIVVRKREEKRVE